MHSTNNKKQTVARQLQHFKESLNTIKKFLQKKDVQQEGCCECGSPACIWSKYDQYVNEDVRSENSPISEVSNVMFTAGATVEDAEVFVNNTKITGVTKAALEYDPEFGLPVLKLEIVSPQVRL